MFSVSLIEDQMGVTIVPVLYSWIDCHRGKPKCFCQRNFKCQKVMHIKVSPLATQKWLVHNILDEIYYNFKIIWNGIWFHNYGLNTWF